MAESKAMGTICANCLSRLRIASPARLSRISQSQSFHNTAPAFASVAKKRPINPAARQFGLRESKSAVIKKKAREKPVVPPVGQRKAERKRIVLSNTNALMVEGLQDLSVDNMADLQSQSNVLALPWPIPDQLGNAEAFKTTQNWKLFRKPATLMRKESVELAQMIKNINSLQVANSDGKDEASKGDGAWAVESTRSFSNVQRAILDGPQGGGKSLLLLQAMAMGFLNQWIVITVPEGKRNSERSYCDFILTIPSAQEFTIAHSSYKPASKAAGDEEQLYTQPHLTSDLLKRIVKANKTVLSKLSLVHEHPDFPVPLQQNMSLDRLADRGVNNPNDAPAVFNALWKELTVPGAEGSQSRPPVMVCIDSINHWMTDTAYRAPDYTKIHAHQFALVRHFLHLLFKSPSAPTLGPSGGMILGATSGSNIPSNEGLEIALKELSSVTRGEPDSSLERLPEVAKFRANSPYNKLDNKVLQLFSTKATSLSDAPYNDNVQFREVSGLSRAETRGFLEYFARSGLLRAKITDELVAEKWSLSSNGLVGYVEKAAARMTA